MEDKRKRVEAYLKQFEDNYVPQSLEITDPICIAEEYLKALDVLDNIRAIYRTEDSPEVQAWAMDDTARQFLKGGRE